MVNTEVRLIIFFAYKDGETLYSQKTTRPGTDMKRGFIRMEVESYEDLTGYKGWNEAKLAGKLRIEGKEYIMQDGDCVFVRFSV